MHINHVIWPELPVYCGNKLAINPSPISHHPIYHMALTGHINDGWNLPSGLISRYLFYFIFFGTILATWYEP
ncbi:hypothetical protein [Escherichia coli]|uniref:hypothetical protein n=1 Tax=Escherichia coli TaxID=562 RepID=UPI001EDE324A|nr:hypothetical protein [Escherichia coli]UKO76932.1 hypothetical protein L7H17_00125 [Escherichia coli]